MIHKNVHFPFFCLILILLINSSCDNQDEFITNHNKIISKGDTFFENGVYDSAYFYYNKAQLNCRENNSEKIFYPLLQISNIQMITGDFSGSESTSTEALSLVSKETDKSYITFIYNILGLTYLEQKNYNEAITNYYKSLELAEDQKSKLIILNNIGYTYLEEKKYSKTISVLEPLLKNKEVENDTINYAKILDNLGYAYHKTNNNQSLDFLLKSLSLRIHLKSDFEKIASYMHLAEYYQKEDINVAKNHALKAYEMAGKTNNPDDKIEALQFLTKLSDGIEAKEYAIQTFKLNDSIQTARQQAKNQFAKIKYDSKQALKELEKQKQLKEFSVIGIVLLFGIGTFAYYRIKKRNRKKIKETAYQTETRIAKKLHDELANDVHNTIAFAETQDLLNQKNKDILLENLETIYNRTRNISNENKDIDTGELYLEKLKAMLATYNSSDRNVIVNVDAFNHLKTSKEIKVVVHRVLQELMVNMKKHSQCSLASISIKSNKKSLQINYSDNGIGTDNLLNLKNGLQNAENRILSINGTINFDTAPEKGFKVKIEIPK